ncbi:MAG: hypothetical protein V4568_05980 [Pseudomonadota bacterium]
MHKKIFVLLVVFLAACATNTNLNIRTNPYTEFYVNQVSGQPAAFHSTTSTPEIRHGGDPKNDDTKMLEDGYVRVGYSIFNGQKIAEAEAATQAKAVGADVVIIYFKYASTGYGAMPFFLPDTQTLTASALGAPGVSPISGAANMPMTANPTAMFPSMNVHRYDHFASYWTKAPPAIFGAVIEEFTVNERQRNGGNIGVVVSAVVKRSPAFMKNIARGDVIKRIGDIDTWESQSYSEAITRYAGMSVKVVLLRNGAEIDKKILLNKAQPIEEAEALPNAASSVIPESITPQQPSPRQSNPEYSESKALAYEWAEKSYQSALKEEWAEVIRTASVAVSLNPEAVNAYINRAWAYTAKGLFNKASADINRALEIEPDNVLALNNRGIIFRNTGAWGLARTDFENACKKSFEVSCNNFKELTGYALSDISLHTGNLLDSSVVSFNNSDWDEVNRISTQILKVDPKNAVAYANRSGAFSGKSMLKEALDDANMAIMLNPDLAIGYQNRGYVLELMGNKNEARIDYEIACQLKLEFGCASFKKLN